jgi:hypothetical protein
MNLPPGVKHWEGPPLEAWSPWSPEQAAEQLAGLSVPWCVVGGWAIDLFLGEPTRSHEDLEIAIARPDFPAVRARLADYALYTAGDGEVRALAAGAEPPPHIHQNWVLDVAAQAWRMDVMLEPGDAETWTFRRDETIRAPRARMVARTRAGIPFLQPEGILLYKAKATRGKDEADFRAVLPRLNLDARAWLAAALARVHPGHAWLAAL